MRKLVLVAIILMVAGLLFAEGAKFSVSGSTGGTAYVDMEGVGTIDADQDVALAYGPVSLGLNLGYTQAVLGTGKTVTFGYTLGFSRPVGSFTFGATAASNSLTVPIGGALTGNWLGDMTATVDLKASDVISAKAYSLFTAKKEYPIFMGVDVSGTYAPKWGSFTVGGSFLDAQAATDGVGYANAVAAVEGLSFYAKAKVTY